MEGNGLAISGGVGDSHSDILIACCVTDILFFYQSDFDNLCMQYPQNGSSEISPGGIGDPQKLHS